MAGNNRIMDMVRRFAGADPETEDTVLDMCYRAAVEWYKGAGVPENPEDELITGGRGHEDQSGRPAASYEALPPGYHPGGT